MENLFVLLSSIFLSFISCSTNNPTEEVVITSNYDDVVVEDGNSLLWRVEGKDIKTSYLYGTMHLIDEEYYHFTDKMTKKIEASDAVIMEVGGMPNPLETLDLMKLDSGDIRSIFTDEEMKTIVAFFDNELDTKPNTFFQIYGKMKPFFIMQAITQHYFSDNTMSYDLDIMGIAGQEEIPLIGLETVEQQLGFFDQIPPSAMRRLVIESIEDFDQEKKSTQKMMKAYAKQKVNKLIPMMKKQSPEFMEFSDIFLYDRNKAWIPILKKEMSDKRCFVAVGAAHLFGEGGIIDLLEKEGYTLTAVSTED
ncbi:MAG: TraB/GumN family protein [Crocinitomicaceae bacterium]